MSLNEQLEKFWTTENCPEGKKLSSEEVECENHYQINTVRDPESGRYCVKLPFKENACDLGESYTNALKRLYALERSFTRKPDFKERYREDINSYIKKGYMTEVESPSTQVGFYLPHHAVIKNTSLTTKLRVVFDGSAKTATGLSLNEVLMVGPTIQEGLFSLLVRFRSYFYVLTADIEKMYLQTMIHPDDRKFQKILWRDDPSLPVKTFELNTVTFGTSAAPFLAIRSLHQLANDEACRFPRAADVLKSDFYVDDMLTGAFSHEEAIQLRDELIEITRKGCLNLRKWASNEPSLIESLSDCANESHFQLNFDTTTKTLGIHWNPKSDSIVFTSQQKSETETTITKRTILSEISQLFDPLGLIGPVIVHGKILIQNLWLLKSDWDTVVPNEIRDMWYNFRDQLPLLSSLQFSRKLVVDNYVNLQIHGFSDASEKAYGAVIYIRSTSREGLSETHLVCSKSRVAPIKSLSLPRLELSAAHLLVKLYRETAQALQHLKFERVAFWSDSTITLHWINTPPNTLETFVRNRVSDMVSITSLIENHEWRHIRSEDNPADLVSRGLLPNELVKSQLWQNGSEWLKENESDWPRSILRVSGTSEPKPTLTSLAVSQISETDSAPKGCIETVNIDILSHFSSSNELKRLIACCNRVSHFAKTKEKITGSLSINELKRANTKMIKLIQQSVLSCELKILNSKNQLSGRFSNLSPFIDSEGIL